MLKEKKYKKIFVRKFFYTRITKNLITQVIQLKKKYGISAKKQKSAKKKKIRQYLRRVTKILNLKNRFSFF